MARPENLSEGKQGVVGVSTEESGANAGGKLNQAQIEANLLERMKKIYEGIRLMEAGMYMTHANMEDMSFQTPGQYGVVTRIPPRRYR